MLRRRFRCAAFTAPPLSLPDYYLQKPRECIGKRNAMFRMPLAAVGITLSLSSHASFRSALAAVDSTFISHFCNA